MLIGVYASPQIVVSLGFGFTKGLGPGGDGCTTNGCFATISVTLFILVIAIWNQFKFKEIPMMEVPEDAKCCKRMALRVHNLIFTLLEPMFVVRHPLTPLYGLLARDQ